jgi:hypothetical protein
MPPPRLSQPPQWRPPRQDSQFGVQARQPLGAVGSLPTHRRLGLPEQSYLPGIGSFNHSAIFRRLALPFQATHDGHDRGDEDRVASRARTEEI